MKYLKCALITAIIAELIVMAALAIGMADTETVKAWVVCHPGSHVNMRSKPGNSGRVESWIGAGTEIHPDGKVRNGWVHIIDVPSEASEGWVYIGYVSTEEPKWEEGKWYHVESNGRVAVRSSMSDGKITGWLKELDEVQVFWRTSEWCYTTRGFVRSEYLVKDGGQDE